jgi:hypothetical protein
VYRRTYNECVINIHTPEVLDGTPKNSNFA